jgi:hypothetical protein
MASLTLTCIFKRTLQLSLPIFLLLFQVEAARAGYVRAYAQAHTSTTSNRDPNNDPPTGSNNINATPTLNTGYLDPSSTISEYASSHAFNDTGSLADAYYDLSVSVGTLRAFVNATGSAAADFVNEPNLFNVAGGNATALVEWGDELTVFGDPGRTVSLRATIILTASGNFTPFTTGDTYSYLDYRFLLPGQNFMNVTLPDGLQGGHRYEQEFLLELSQGRSYNLSAALNVQANAAARINDPNPLWKSYSYSTMDAGHTAQLFLEVLTPGGSYSLASGAVLNPVPEPSTALLMGLGLVGLAGVRTRFRGAVTRRSGEHQTKLLA